MSAPGSVRRVLLRVRSVRGLFPFVTDVTEATVGLGKEGLHTICPGSSFEKGC